jgi:hypothetical protein
LGLGVRGGGGEAKRWHRGSIRGVVWDRVTRAEDGAVP